MIRTTLYFAAAFFVAVVVYGCAASQLARSGLEGYDARPQAVAVTQARNADEHAYHFKSTPAVLELRDRLEKLDAEARCKSNAKRLQSGECD